MGQQAHSQATSPKKSEAQAEIKYESSDNSNIQLISISEGQAKKEVSQLFSLSYESPKRLNETPQTTRQQLQREEKLLEFIGEIIYYCKMHMKKQRKFHYKISALLFYKYFFDKFRQLLTKYWDLYQKQEIFREEYEKKVTLVYQVKDTFIKIKKFVYSKIPFLSEKTKSFLDEDSKDYCFTSKEFFNQLLYPEVKEIMEFYNENIQSSYDQAGINTCYLRMLKGIFIIEELEFNNIVVKPQENEAYPSYDIDKIENWSEAQVRSDLIKCYQLFQTLELS